MNKYKIKILAYLIALTSFLTACGILEAPEDIIDNELTLHNPTTSVGTMLETQTPSIEQTLPPVVETNPTIEETNPTIEETKPNVEESKPVIEETKPEVTHPVVESSDNMVVYATTNVNFRSSNSADSMKIGNLNVGDAAYRILSCDNNWDLVRYNGQLGFVCRDYLEYSNEYVSSSYEHMPKNDIVLTNTDLNFRSEPSTDGKKLDTFDEGTELQVLAEVDNGWLLVRHNGELGYVKADYTTSLLEKVNYYYPELELDELVVEKVIYNTSNELNLREGEGTDTEIKDELTKYETARVLKETEDWYLVMTNDYEFGYLYKDYTKEMEGIFVVVDKSEQRMTLYNDNEVMVQTPVTTGKDSTPSDTGYFEIYSKSRNEYLMNNSFVQYWMPYNGGEGIHDASWRSDSEFGTEIYHKSGSHGCINTPLEEVIQIYNNVKVGTKVLVHK